MVYPVWHRLILRSRWAVWVGLLVLMSPWLSGCIVSRDAVFDTKDAVAPFAVGRYKVERFEKPDWKPESTWTFHLAGNTYYVDDPTNGRIEIRLFEVDYDLYIAEQRARSERLYGLVRVNNGSIFLHFINCDDFLKSDAAKRHPPREQSGDFISRCFYDDNEQLYAALLGYADKAEVFYRLSPMPETAEAAALPKADAPPKVEMTALKLCNKSPMALQSIVRHQHRNDQAKQMLAGWYDLPAGQCRDIGQFPRPGLSVFAVGHDGAGRHEWLGQSGTYCVSPRQTYRVIQENEKCIPGEAAKRFAEINTTANSFTYTFFWNDKKQ